MQRPGKDSEPEVYDLPKRAPFSDAELLARTMSLGKQSYFVLDAETNELTWPDSTFSLWGLEPKDTGLVKLDWVFSTIPEDERDAVSARYLAKDWDDLAFDHAIVLPDGSRRRIRTRAARDRDADGRVIRVFGLLQDITG